MKRAKELFAIFVINFFKCLKESVYHFKQNMRFKCPAKCNICGKFYNRNDMMAYGLKKYCIIENCNVLKFIKPEKLKKLKDNSMLYACDECQETHNITLSGKSGVSCYKG